MLNAPIIYHAHAITGEYLGPGEADPDPMDDDNWLIPAHAYLDAPPNARKGEAVIRTEAGWERVPDFRGTLYRTEDGEPVEHDQVGPLPEGFTHRPRPSPDHRWAGNRWILDKKLQEQNLKALADQLLQEIDAAADMARHNRVGDPLRSLEYQRAAEEAAAFKAAAYPSDAVPPLVAVYVIGDRTPQQAADEILREAAGLDAALLNIRSLRLQAKEQVREAITSGDIEAAQHAASEAVIRVSQPDEATR